MKVSYAIGSALTGLLALGAATQSRAADIIPYPTPGVYNATTYTFTATATEQITAYFVDAKAADDSVLGLLINGVSTGVFGLDNQTSVPGQSLNLGVAHAGDVLTFVLQNNTKGTTLYSDPTLNGDGFNHIYSTAYTATGPIVPGVPPGTYVAFEDRVIPGADLDYNDDQFVFTQVKVPEPGTWAMMMLGIGAVGYALRRSKAPVLA